MRMINLSDEGPEVSALGFGCNNFGHNPFGNFVEYAPCERVVRAALEHGYAFFDTADVYGLGESEEYLGRALGSDRTNVMIATKFGASVEMPGAPPVPRGTERYIRWAIEGSLRRLDTDHVDLYQMHAPDPATPIEETLGVLSELIDEGKVRFIGVAGFSPEQLEAAAITSRERALPYPISSMTYYSLLTRRYEPDVIAACIRLGIRVHPWFALESGLLTGKFRRDRNCVAGARFTPLAASVPGKVWDALERLEAFACARGITMVELAIGGIAAMPGVGVVIVGASTPEQVAANARARDWTPSAADVEELRALPSATPSQWLD
jgi:aryl-alcohol dehydrogenase-like predicted oxidoreductase